MEREGLTTAPWCFSTARSNSFASDRFPDNYPRPQYPNQTFKCDDPRPRHPAPRPTPSEPEKYELYSPSPAVNLEKFLNNKLPESNPIITGKPIKGVVCRDNKNPTQCYNALNKITTMSPLNIPQYIEENTPPNAVRPCPSGRPANKGFYDVLYQEGDQNVIFSCSNKECKLLQNEIGKKCPSYIPLAKHDCVWQCDQSTSWCGGSQQPLPSSGCDTNRYPFEEQCCACGKSPGFVVGNKNCN